MVGDSINTNDKNKESFPKKETEDKVAPANPDQKESKAIERLENFLIEKAPESYNYGTLAKELGMNENTVRTCLSRLYNRGRIKQEHKGFYRALIEADKIFAWLHGDIQLHGIKIEAKFPENTVIDGGHGLVALIPTSQDLRRTTYNTEFDGRSITISVHKNGLVEVFNRCSKQPLGFLDFNRFTAFLHGIFPCFDVMGARLIQVGLNVDSRVLRLDGVKSIKFQTFENAWLSMYQKAGRGLRTEVHINPKELTLTEALNILKHLTNFPQNEVSQLDKMRD